MTPKQRKYWEPITNLSELFEDLSILFSYGICRQNTNFSAGRLSKPDEAGKKKSGPSKVQSFTPLKFLERNPV